MSVFDTLKLIGDIQPSPRGTNSSPELTCQLFTVRMQSCHVILLLQTRLSPSPPLSSIQAKDNLHAFFASLSAFLLTAPCLLGLSKSSRLSGHAMDQHCNLTREILSKYYSMRVQLISSAGQKEGNKKGTISDTTFFL